MGRGFEAQKRWAKTFCFGLHLILGRKTDLGLGWKIFILVFIIFKFLPPPLSKILRKLLDIAKFTIACVPCQQPKIHCHNSAPLQSFRQPDSRFSAIHCDLVGPLPESCGNAYLVTIIDRFTRHLECIPLRKITVKACVEAVVLNWVARFGCLQVMTCDRGIQFTSHLWAELCNFLGCKLVHTQPSTLREYFFLNASIER